MATQLSIVIMLSMLAFAMPAAIKPKSCLQEKLVSGTLQNGYFILYDKNNQPYTTFCDFHSDPGFVWTLVESLSLTNSRKAKYRKSFDYNAPTPSCTRINWQEYRLSTATMKSIKNARGSTHYRATCNFNPDDIKGIRNHRDYLRVSSCNYQWFFKSSKAYHCTKVDYVNIRGHTCRQCSIPIWDGGNSFHLLIHVNYAAGFGPKTGFATQVTSSIRN
ncbi:uncharacterized protein TRIADDRAFT_60639 [Trichoplax adhaerens]|uniref:Fibrinogen C-terminal domain-containing protein n=1 Tax=Trichoplax adhaerens TaxID=10228 RepID=B3S8R9_TRIAD|nr:predicted protein [Trichoplax adhaerens]EDV21000.1 predicted protein [Trichoplax adhaerens]|eukprot:XP_002116644.1 predicted protein [Trichoplax adhaerens]